MRYGVVYDVGVLLIVEGIVKVEKALGKVDVDPRIGDWSLDVAEAGVVVIFAVPVPAPTTVSAEVGVFKEERGVGKYLGGNKDEDS